MTDFGTARQFGEGIIAACNALDSAANAADRAKVAEQRVALSESKLAAHAAEQRRLTSESDAHVATNRAAMSKELEEHAKTLADLKTQHAAFETRHKEQMNSASSALTDLNAAIGIARTQRNDLLAEIARLRAQLHDVASKLA